MSHCGQLANSLRVKNQPAKWRGMMKINQVFYYHPEKAQGARTSLLLELYQTLS